VEQGLEGRKVLWQWREKGEEVGGAREMRGGEWGGVGREKGQGREAVGVGCLCIVRVRRGL
jgi:hypothetical protein